MDSIILIFIIIGCTLQSVVKKMYNKRVSGGAFTFSAGSSAIALVFFLITSGGKLNFTSDFIPYSIGFAVTFSAATVFSFLAIVEGSLALTSLVTSYSLLIPTVYGLIALHEPIDFKLILGILLLMVSLLLINIESKGEKKKLTWKWAIYVLLAFVGNGGCSLVQKVQQIQFEGQYKNEFMIVAYGISVVALLASAIFYDKKVLYYLKTGWYCWVANGAFNGLVNLLVMVLAMTMAASVMFPLISAGGIVATFFVSLLVYKERFSVAQTIGLLLGIGSVVLLNM